MICDCLVLFGRLKIMSDAVKRTWYIFERSERVLKKQVPCGSCYEERSDFDDIASVSLLINL